MNCAICSSPFAPANAQAKFCSAGCRRMSKRARELDRRRRRNRERSVARAQAGCLQCGQPFTPGSALKQFCSEGCRYAARDARPEVAAAKVARRRELRQAGLMPPVGWNSMRDRAAWFGVEFEQFERAEIFTRDGWVCGLCSSPIDPAAAWPAPGSASIDHIVPWARGGSHTRANVQAAHLACNVAKGTNESARAA